MSSILSIFVSFGYSIWWRFKQQEKQPLPISETCGGIEKVSIDVCEKASLFIIWSLDSLSISTFFSFLQREKQRFPINVTFVGIVIFSIDVNANE